MYVEETKKPFMEPEYEVVKFTVADILTTSDNGDLDGEWDLGEF